MIGTVLCIGDTAVNKTVSPNLIELTFLGERNTMRKKY